MKVYEIISESQVEEASLMAWGLGKLMGAGAKALSKPEFLDRAGQQILAISKQKGIPFAQAAEEVFKSPAQVAKDNKAIQNLVAKTGMSPEKAAERLGVDAHPFYSDMSLKAKAISKAKTLRGGEVLAKGGEVAGKAKAVLDHVPTLLNAIGLGTVFIPPYLKYKENMDNAEEYLKAREWTQEQYNRVENQQMSILIGQWAVGLLVKGIAGKLLNNSATRLFLGKTIPGLAGGAAGIAAVTQWLHSPENAKSLASVMASDIVSGNNELGLGVGSIGADVKNMLPGGKSPTAPDASTSGGSGGAPSGATGTGSASDIDATSNKPAAGTQTTTPATTQSANGKQMWTNDPNAVTNYDISGWVDYPNRDGYIMDPKNPSRILPKPTGWTPGYTPAND